MAGNGDAPGPADCVVPPRSFLRRAARSSSTTVLLVTAARSAVTMTGVAPLPSTDGWIDRQPYRRSTVRASNVGNATEPGADRAGILSAQAGVQIEVELRQRSKVGEGVRESTRQLVVVKIQHLKVDEFAQLDRDAPG